MSLGHTLAALIHLLSASALFALQQSYDASNHYLYAQRFKYTLLVSRNASTLNLEREVLLHVNPILLLALNEIITCLSHVWALSRVDDAVRRWISYCITAGLLSLAVGLSAGPLNILFVPFILLGNVNLQMIGLRLERQGHGWALGFLLLIPPIFFASVRTSLVEGTKSMIGYAWVAVLYGLFYISFAAWLWYARKRRLLPAGFVILSLTSKLTLSWLLTGILFEASEGVQTWGYFQVAVLSIGGTAIVVLFSFLFATASRASL